MTAPPRPSYERFASWLFFALAPRLQRRDLPAPPALLRPWETFPVPRRHAEGTLSATWFPAACEARGAVLMLHPWVPWGQTYFHRRRRVPALRQAGYHVMTVDLPTFGKSGPRRGFPDRDVEDALRALEARAMGLPLHLWGVSAGGYWAHPVLARTRQVSGAFFEDVSPHLLEWSWRMAPWGRPMYAFFRHVLRDARRFLDIRRHATYLGVEAVEYVSGAEDRGVWPEDTRTLARAAGGRCLIVPSAGHLESIKRAQPEILERALATFERAEAIAERTA